MRNTPWLHQKRSESAPPTERVKEPPSITQKQQDEIVSRISRPTESARYRQSLYWKLDGFMDKGFHSWSKMDLFEDCKQCMWTPDGTIKSSCKIRPINAVLPPLKFNGRGSSSRSVCASQGDGRCESRRVSVRPNSIMRRSNTVLGAKTSQRYLCHPTAGHSFSLHNLKNGSISNHSTAATNISNAVPRLNSQPTTAMNRVRC